MQDLESEMQVRQAVKQFIDSWETHKQAIETIAKYQREYFLSLRQQGFSVGEALRIVAAFHPLNIGGRGE